MVVTNHGAKGESGIFQATQSVVNATYLYVWMMGWVSRKDRREQDWI